MLQAAAAMAPSLAELIPSPSAPPPTTLCSGSISTFADFGPKLSPIHHHQHDAALVDPVYMLKFPVALHDHHHKSHDDDAEDDNHFPEQEIDIDSNEGAVQLEFNTATGTTCSDQVMNHNNNSNRITMKNRNGKRKRARSGKTSEEAENQRMAHIAVERNRRKQMNEHLRLLRSLMPTSYVQRGDQASIVGGAIEFVRELEQLLQCLESQKRRRIYGEDVALTNDDQIIDGGDHAANLDRLTAPNSGLAGLYEETAESESAIADVEVKLVGFDAFIKILTRRRPGQLVKAISALQDLEFTILHTNVTTIEQTALYSFNVKIGSETRFRADDIASSVQHIFTFIHANSAI